MSADDKIPTRRNGCRYVPAAKVAWLSNAPPGVLCEQPVPLGLSLLDRAATIGVEASRWGARGRRTGYRSIFASVGIAQGDHYWECIWEAPDGVPAALRIGVGSAEATVLGPIGVDTRGIGWCPDGTIFHGGAKRPFSAKGFGAGDLLGCRLCIPPPASAAAAWLRQKRPSRTAVDYFGDYFEESIRDRQVASKSAAVAPPGEPAFVEFYKNGTCQGRFSLPPPLLTAGMLYPVFSLYGNVALSVNFGPHYLLSPSGAADPPSPRPLGDAVRPFVVGGALSDLQNLLVLNKHRTP